MDALRSQLHEFFGLQLALQARPSWRRRHTSQRRSTADQHHGGQHLHLLKV